MYSQGTIEKVDANRGFGFISPDDKTGRVFFHLSALDRATLPFSEALIGRRVSFNREVGERGPRAENIHVAE